MDAGNGSTQSPKEREEYLAHQAVLRREQPHIAVRAMSDERLGELLMHIIHPKLDEMRLTELVDLHLELSYALCDVGRAIDARFAAMERRTAEVREEMMRQ
jgi:hypothetical protein